VSEEGTAAAGPTGVAVAPAPTQPNGAPPMAVPGKTTDYTDGRAPYDWQSKFPAEARKYICREAFILAITLVVLICFTTITLVFSGATYPVALPASGPNVTANVDPRAIVLLLCGAVGGTTFSIKWLIRGR
jgi:hypothetical protein